MPLVSTEIVLSTVGWLVVVWRFGVVLREERFTQTARATGRLVYVGDELLDCADRNIHDLNRARQRLIVAVPWKGRR